MKNKNLFLTIYDILWYSVISVQEVMWGSSGVPLRGLSQCERRIGRLFQWLVWLVALAPQGEAEKFSQILWRFNTLKSLSKITSSETCVIPDCQVVSCVRSVSSSNIFSETQAWQPINSTSGTLTLQTLQEEHELQGVKRRDGEAAVLGKAAKTAGRFPWREVCGFGRGLLPF